MVVADEHSLKRLHEMFVEIKKEEAEGVETRGTLSDDNRQSVDQQLRIPSFRYAPAPGGNGKSVGNHPKTVNAETLGPLSGLLSSSHIGRPHPAQ
jgi:hypothetical protein